MSRHPQLARIGRKDHIEQLGKGGFARAVVPEDRHVLALVNIQRKPAQHGGVGLSLLLIGIVQILGMNKSFVHRLPHSSQRALAPAGKNAPVCLTGIPSSPAVQVPPKRLLTRSSRI